MILDRVFTQAATGNGSGNVTWTAAAQQYALPPASIDTTVTYTLLDSGGSAWETGSATLAESGGTYTLTRGGSQTVRASSNSGSAISLTNSSAHTLFLAPDALKQKSRLMVSLISSTRLRQNGTFELQQARELEYLIVGGGGGGQGGGGGGGGARQGSLSSLTLGQYPVVIGSGGAGERFVAGTNGGNSSVFGVVANGGGGGGYTVGSSGGTGGGGAAEGGSQAGGQEQPDKVFPAGLG
jgi:hypothetical protein